MGNEYGQKAVKLCGWEVKAGMAHSTCGYNSLVSPIYDTM